MKMSYVEHMRKEIKRLLGVDQFAAVREVIDYFRAQGTPLDHRKADSMEEALSVMRAERARKLKLPATIDDLGDAVSVSYGDAGDGLGFTDPKSGEIVIGEGQPALGDVANLIGGMLHLVESSSLEQGMLTEEIPHEFLKWAGCAVAVVLARCGALSTVSPDEVSDQVEELNSDD